MTAKPAKPYIVPATVEHAIAMAPHLRQIDADEMWSQGAWRPLEGLIFSVQNSEAFTAIDPADGQPILIFGVGPISLLDNSRSVWLLGTDRIGKIKKQFLVESANYLNLIAAGSTVYNHVLTNNDLSLRWLKWLGFSIMDAKPHGWLAKSFHYVEKAVPSCVPLQQQH